MFFGCTVVSIVMRAMSSVFSAPVTWATRWLSARRALAVADATFATHFDFRDAFAGGVIFHDTDVTVLQIPGLVRAQNRPLRRR